MTSGVWPIIAVCENWFRAPLGKSDPDFFVKERLSFVEIAFRKRAEWLAEVTAGLPQKIEEARRAPRGGLRLPGDIGEGMRAMNDRRNAEFENMVEQLNARFVQAGTNLHYHNGFIQISGDELVSDRIDVPFWNLVAGEKWKNVDLDIKEAIDRRDTGGRDPAFYAARALESAIKITSDEIGETTGSERGAHNFIDNLSKTGVQHIQPWEADLLKKFFSAVRNPLGHGPGSADMPKLSAQQTDLAIEFAMSWIKYFVSRLT